MTIERVTSQETPRLWERLDYQQLARDYNALAKGQSLRLRKVTNITNFKAALARRDLEVKKDYRAGQKGRHCYLTRLSDKPMTE